MSRRTSYLERKERQNKIKAMDGLLNSLPFLNDRIRQTSNKIDEINQDLEYGGLRSPSIIRDYVSDQHPTQAPHETLIMKKTEYEAELKDLNHQKALVESRIQELDEFDREMILMRYGKNMTYDNIAICTNMSRDAVRRTIANILADL